MSEDIHKIVSKGMLSSLLYSCECHLGNEMCKVCDILSKALNELQELD